MVDVARLGAAAGELLRPELEVLLSLLRRRHVALGLPEDLDRVSPDRQLVLVGRAAAGPFREPGPLDPLADGLWILGAVGAKADTAEGGLRPLGDDQARMQPLRPATQIDRL